MARQLLEIVDVYPGNFFWQCGVDGCSIVSPHQAAIVGSTGPGNYKWMHPWDDETQKAEAESN